MTDNCSKNKPNSNPRQRSALEGFTYVPKGTKNGNVLDNFGVFLATFCAVWDKFGTIKDKLGNTKTTKNSVISTKTTKI